ncbi:MAG: DNA polymerase IV [Casimicrobiaceae bacterium]
MRLIAHLDMDAFYASVELLRYPELRGRPVVIGGGRRHEPEAVTDPATGATRYRFQTLRGYVGRGVVTTATYEARALGLHSAQPMMRAAALAPEAILLPVDFDAYRHYSRQFKAAVAALAPTIEDRGIDEIYIDLTDVTPPGGALCEEPAPDADRWHTARDVAASLKAAVRSTTGLTCSIAVAPNKLLAKIASELDKPDGLTLLRPADIPSRIWPLPVRRINGIGPKSSARLQALGIATIGALASADSAFLIREFGPHYGAWLHEAAHGRDYRAVVTHSEPKSISRERTFERDLSPRDDRAALSAIFTELCAGVADDLTRKGYVGRTIGLKLRFDNFRTVTRDQTIVTATADPALIRRAAGECLRRVTLERRIRLLGVRVGALVCADATTEIAGPPVPDPMAYSLF